MTTPKKATPAPERRPTYPEALEMFAANPGLAWIQTEDGNLSRDGVLVKQAQGE